MTPLADLLLARIARDGPISIASFMADALMHPVHGYYATRDPFGAAGDFTTATEISQMFGELIGLSLAQVWLDQGAPDPVTLAELGPGRGTLMADILRATAAVPGFHAAVTVHFVETSPHLRALQAERVPQARWHDRIDTLPDAPLLLVANEFFDALPIRQFIRAGAGWRERMVGAQDGHLFFGLSDAAPLALLAPRLDDTQDGDLVEHCPALPGIVAAIAGRIAAHGGAALVIDYGDWQSLGGYVAGAGGPCPRRPTGRAGCGRSDRPCRFRRHCRPCRPRAPQPPDAAGRVSGTAGHHGAGAKTRLRVEWTGAGCACCSTSALDPPVGNG